MLEHPDLTGLPADLWSLPTQGKLSSSCEKWCTQIAAFVILRVELQQNQRALACESCDFRLSDVELLHGRPVQEG